MDRKIFLKNLRRLTVGTGRKTDALAHCVMIKNTEDGIELKSTNTAGIITSSLIYMEKPPRVEAPVIMSQLIDALKRIQDDNISLRAKGDYIYVIGESSDEIRIPTYDSDELNKLELLSPHVTVDNFVRALMDLKYFAEKQPTTRRAFSNVFYDHENNNLVATNGHIIGIISSPSLSSIRRSILIPRDAITPIKKMVGLSSILDLELRSNGMTISSKGGHISLEEGEEKYPPYLHVIPDTRRDEVVSIDIGKLDRFKRNQLVRLECEDGNVIGRSSIKVKKADEIYVDVGVAGTTYSGVIVFNVTLLRIISKFMGSNTIDLMVKNNVRSAVVRSVYRTAAIMPIRINDELLP